MRPWLLLVPVVAAAFWLRTHDLAARPMHADEANQAVKTGELLEHGRYAFDPRDHHGPVLYYAALPIAWVRGQRTLASLDETTLRLVPAIAGTASVALLFWLALSLGVWPALTAAALLAVSPPAVYYSRYFVQETLLVAFTLGLLACARQWWHTTDRRWVIAAGLCAGLMQSSKASTPLFLSAAVVAALAAPGFVAQLSRRSHLTRDLALAIGAALVTAALFYSSFGTHPAGLIDAIATYRLTAERLGAGATGHEKPWPYYLQLFGVQRWGGFSVAQSIFPLLIGAGALVALSLRRPVVRWILVYTGLIVLLLSSSAYKTPWHAIHFVPPFALLIAVGVHAACAKSRVAITITAVLTLASLGTLLYQTRFVAFLRPADARNPFAYVHSAADVKKYRALAGAALARHPDRPIRVISEESWPLPWYFRGLEKNTGYWSTPPADCDGALVIASEHQSAAVRDRLRDRYEESILGLRPGFIMVVFMRVTAP